MHIGEIYLESDWSEFIYHNGTYLRNHPSWHVEDSTWKAAKVLRLLEDNGIRPATVCDIGCGAGEVVLNLVRHMPGTSFTGYEVSADAYALCKAKEQANVSFLLRDVRLEDMYHDLLLCLDVFEHVENCLAFLRSLAGKAGRYVFLIPLEISVNASLRESILRDAREKGGHLHHFSRYTALHTLAGAGYEVLDWQYASRAFDEPFGNARQRAARLLRRLTYRISPELCVRTLGGFSILVLARDRRQ